MNMHAEIEYGRVHSDLCPENCETGPFTEDYRALLHSALDEALDQMAQNNQALFYVRAGAFRNVKN